MNAPIIEYKLSKESKIIYNKILRMTDNKMIKKIELKEDEYNVLLKAIPFHRRDNFLNTMHINGKLIVRID